jgi:methyl-galactoside transport system permease protein
MKSNPAAAAIAALRKIDHRALRTFAFKYAIYVVFALLVVFISVFAPGFASLANLRNILEQSAVPMIVALGVGGILISGGTDLSAGRQVGLSAVVAASMLQALDYSRRIFPSLPELPVFVPILIAICACAAVGVLNGLVVAYLKVPPFIATLGTMVIVLGANSIYYSSNREIGAQPIAGFVKGFTAIGQGSIPVGGGFSIPFIVLIAFAAAVVVWVLHNKTRFGKNIYAIGGNAEAARVSGVNVAGTLVAVYALAGGLYGLAGTLEAARTGAASNQYGAMYELDAIAACVVGGVSTSGGIGTVPGMMIGVMIFTVINYGLTFLGVDPYWQQIAKGSIIVAAVAIDIRKYLTRR